MFSPARHRSPEELTEAARLAKEVHRSRDLLDTTQQQALTTTVGGVYWDELSNTLAACFDAHQKAATDERAWWQSKGFKV